MQRIPQVLQLPVIIDWGRPLASQLQSLEECDFLFRDIATQRPILQELFEARFYGDGLWRLLLCKLESLQVAAVSRRLGTTAMPKS